MEHYMGLEARKCPPAIGHKDCGIARRCILFLGTELERGAMVLEDPFVWPPMERHAEFAAPTCKLSLTLSERTTWVPAVDGGLDQTTFGSSGASHEQTQSSPCPQRSVSNEQPASSSIRSDCLEHARDLQ